MTASVNRPRSAKKAKTSSQTIFYTLDTRIQLFYTYLQAQPQYYLFYSTTLERLLWLNYWLLLLLYTGLQDHHKLVSELQKAVGGGTTFGDYIAAGEYIVMYIAYASPYFSCITVCHPLSCPCCRLFRGSRQPQRKDPR